VEYFENVGEIRSECRRHVIKLGGKIRQLRDLSETAAGRLYTAPPGQETQGNAAGGHLQVPCHTISKQRRGVDLARYLQEKAAWTRMVEMIDKIQPGVYAALKRLAVEPPPPATRATCPIGGSH
jgi:hypothetical protein